ncbi:hypothetical protein ACH4FX_21935 [Streptomyces sp. NPDC018019]|uniref:hypothetical protein n=1 Tax=Streptomyces sp. NPDC018019 TaxID=3365030 RepID=UPI0037ACEF36
MGGHRVNRVLYTAPPPGPDLGLDTPTSLPPGTLGGPLHASFAQVTGELLPPYRGGLFQLTRPEELFCSSSRRTTSRRPTTPRAGCCSPVTRPRSPARTPAAER